MRKVLADPLLHFVVLGAVLFLALPGEPEPASDGVVRVSADTVEALKAAHRRAVGRSASPEELQGLVEAHVEEELLVRRARELGLERGDPIVRRRLAEKMRLLLRGAVREPTEEQLADWLREHPRRFTLAETRTFQHVFIRDDPGAAERADRIRASLAAGEDPAALGDAFLRGRRFTDLDRAAVAAIFGADFAGAVWPAPVGVWFGPVRSQLGIHLVRVDARDDAHVPELGAVRDRVRADWLEARRAEAERAAIARLREGVTVEVAP